MVPARSHKVPRVSWYSGYRSPFLPFTYGAFTLFGRSSQDRSVRLSGGVVRFQTPACIALRFGLFRVRSPLLAESMFSFFSSGYLDVSVHRVPPAHLSGVSPSFSVRQRRFPPLGFPIQISAGRWIFAPHRSFSQLITSFFGSQCQGILPALFLA